MPDANAADNGESAEPPVSAHLVLAPATRAQLPSADEIPLAYIPAQIELDAQLVKSNALVNARYSLPLNAHRVLSYCLSVLNKDIDKAFPLMKIPVVQVAETFPGLSGSGTVYEDIGKALDQLFEASISIKQGKDFVRLRWAPTCGRVGGWIFIRLNEDLRPYLKKLVKQFTVYRLRFVLELRTAYQYRFYELFKSQQYLGKCTLYYEELKAWLEIPKDDYTYVGHFKDRILQPSIKAINDVTDIQVDIVQPIKEGRRVIGWLIRIRSKPQEQLPLPPTVAPIIERLVADGLSAEEARTLARDYDEDYLKEKITWVEREFEAGRVQSLPAFLRKAVVEDWQPPTTREALVEAKERARTAAAREREARESYRQLVEEAKRDAPRAIRQAQAVRRLAECSKAEREEVERAFADAIIRKSRAAAIKYGESGHESELVQTYFKAFLVEHFAIAVPSLAEIQKFAVEMAATPPIG
jgi:hypothetical protein